MGKFIPCPSIVITPVFRCGHFANILPSLDWLETVNRSIVLKSGVLTIESSDSGIEVCFGVTESIC